MSSSEFMLYNIIYGYSAEPDIWYNRTDHDIERERNKFLDIYNTYHRLKKISPKLRRAHEKFRKMETAFEDFVNHHKYMEMTVLSLVNRSTTDFDTYASIFLSNYGDGMIKYEAFIASIRRFSCQLGRLLVESEVETHLFLLCLGALLCCTTVLLSSWLYSLYKETSQSLKAQEKLARQQAHEMRNKFSPAIYQMQLFLEVAEKGAKATVKEFLSMMSDVRVSLVALKEVEQDHQARLDVYKIMRGHYKSTKETFDIISLMLKRVKFEKAIAFSKDIGTDLVAYNIHLADTIQKYRAIHVKTDLYILNHVFQNCLSNSRKFTKSGRIDLTFKGEHNGLLIFRIRDSGIGLPPHVEKNLFRKEVVTGDNRGTGLGLPSCALFCKTVGGYIKLVETQQQNEICENGFTEMEFAVAGKIIRVDERSERNQECSTAACPTLQPSESIASELSELPTPTIPLSVKFPDDVSCVVVDDSGLNRKFLVRSLKKVAKATAVKGWTYIEFETIEASMPFIRKLHEDQKDAIVCLDENLDSRGGVMTGIQGTKWLIQELGFRGVIISTSGDPEAGFAHIKLGAHCNWGKPYPHYDIMMTDLQNTFAKMK